MTGDGNAGNPRARRESGARMTVSEPVVFRRDDTEIRGWTLNMSRGGVRCIVDAELAVGDHFEVEIGEGGQRRGGHVVWIKPDKAGGCILGIAFDDAASAPPPPPANTEPPAAGAAIPKIPPPPATPGAAAKNRDPHDE